MTQKERDYYLLGCCRQIHLAGINALDTFAGSVIIDGISQMSGGFWCAAFDVRALENDARHGSSLAVLILHRIRKSDRAARLLDLLDAPPTQTFQRFRADVHLRGQHVHHHVHFHGQLEE